MARAKKDACQNVCLFQFIPSMPHNLVVVNPIVVFPMFRHVIGLKAGGQTFVEGGEDLKLMPAA
jgi:hypothetical protein